MVNRTSAAYCPAALFRRLEVCVLGIRYWRFTARSSTGALELIRVCAVVERVMEETPVCPEAPSMIITPAGMVVALRVKSELARTVTL